MPALAFGLKPSKPGPLPPKAPAKRRAAFDEPQDDAEDDNDAFGLLQKPKSRLQSMNNGPRKSPKLDTEGSSSNKYTNLSALRTAKLQDEAASKLDPSAYSYDEVYDTFSASKDKKNGSADGAERTVPKYMTNLLASAEVRKRDQLKAKEKALQKERDAEGEEFEGKEKFVTSAYKTQQEEMRKLEEEEKRREEADEERRKKGGGMVDFHKELLKRDEERMKAVEEAVAQVQVQAKAAGDVDGGNTELETEEEKTESKIAAELNSAGAKIVVNDDGEIVDKRQLLTAGLNVAAKKRDDGAAAKKAATASRPQEWQRSVKAQDARVTQRERQTRMMELQIEEMEAKAREAEAAERKELEEKNKTKLTENDKMSAKERYLQRKKEREEEARKAKEQDKAGPG
ncbi:hypothetical protein H2198_005219 [Neophaeococcomyces mojaviensis]|uniref:Uncharacterized protein n=1 Tax=Neophaeococcomyces mojaviensis TaxID=3383035 RepID=A0ACC3A6D1_9EURO|nr:hypothetical protein H2198_005219 [Knufia sp. JES_112]